MSDFLSQFSVGGATRPDSFSGMDPAFVSALAQMFGAAPPDIQSNLRIGSGFRSNERQAQLWDQALKKYGSPSAARKWVAPPGRSQHNHGRAADLKYLNDAAREWAHANAANYKLAFPLSNENWHIELADARNGHNHGAPATPAPIGAEPQSLAGLMVPDAHMPTAGIGDLVARSLNQRQTVAKERNEDEEARRTALLSQIGWAFA